MLTAEVGEKPEEEGQNDADDEASDDGEIERGVFAAMDDVAGEATEAEGETTVEIEESADDGDDGAKEKEGAAEFTEGDHRQIVARRSEVMK
jgi:hypothetical protein